MIRNIVVMLYQPALGSFVVVWGYHQKSVSARLLGLFAELNSICGVIAACTGDYRNFVVDAVDDKFDRLAMFFMGEYRRLAGSCAGDNRVRLIGKMCIRDRDWNAGFPSLN